jgi:hypothetical protein
MGVSAVKPNAVGNYSEWEGNHVETGDTSLATGASSSDVGTKLSSVPSPFVGPATSAFRALLILNKASTRGTIVGDLRNFVRIAATDYPAAAMGANETIKDRVTVWNVNPNTGIDWGSADIASVEIGIETLSA